MESDSDIERRLRQYRPRGPAPDLRQRILAQPAPIRLWPAWAFRAAIAAMLLLAFTLNRAAQRINDQTAASVGLGPVVWTHDAEQAAQLVDGGERGRQYIALCLMASTGRDSLSNENPSSPGGFP